MVKTPCIYFHASAQRGKGARSVLPLRVNSAVEPAGVKAVTQVEEGAGKHGVHRGEPKQELGAVPRVRGEHVKQPASVTKRLTALGARWSGLFPCC